MTYQLIQEWIALERAPISPTTAATNLYNALIAAGAKAINLGQGRETVELPLLQSETIAEFQKQIEGGKLINSKYGAPSTNLNEISAAWLKRIMNVGTAKNTTFTIENQGRGGLYAAFHLLASLAKFPSDGKIIMPDSSWPMVADQLNDFQLKPAYFAMEKGRYAENIRAMLEANQDSVVGVYINSPHNPTGQILTKQDFEQVFAVLNGYNSGEKLAKRNGRKIGLIMDNPYPHACPSIHRDAQEGLDAGLDAFTQDQATPWIMPVSASKFFGTAEPGFSMIAAHSYYAEMLKGRLMRSIGIGFFPAFFHALTTVLQPKYDGQIMGHFSLLREKYIENRETLEAVFGQSVVAGNAGMTALIKLDPKDYVGRTMSKNDGSDFPISDLNDVIEYLANKHGVITVNNSTDNKPGIGLLRLAAAEQPEAYRQGAINLAAGLVEIKLAPARNPSPATMANQQKTNG